MGIWKSCRGNRQKRRKKQPNGGVLQKSWGGIGGRGADLPNNSKATGPGLVEGVKEKQWKKRKA